MVQANSGGRGAKFMKYFKGRKLQILGEFALGKPSTLPLPSN
jgi:hypothetical protein